MSDVLVDSCVWIDYFRAGRGPLFDAVDSLLDQGRVILCGMVELEIIQGLRPLEARRVRALFAALRFLPTEREDFVAAGRLLQELRRRGAAIPSSDALIAALCIRNRLRLLSTDNHFDRVPRLDRFEIDR
jgi:predicted nucleic acid-binding protein